MFCNNKGCYKEQEPLLDIENNLVHCTECGLEIKDVSKFVKVQMQTIGQVKREIVNQTFAVKCTECNKSATPKLEKGELVCKFCAHKLELSGPYAYAIKQYLTNKLK